MYRSVGVEEVRTARVHAPEVEQVTQVVNLTGLKRIRAVWTFGPPRPHVVFSDAEDHFRGAVLVLAPARIPPTEPLIRAGRAFPDHEGIAHPVCDVGKTDLRIQVEKPVVAE